MCERVAEGGPEQRAADAIMGRCLDGGRRPGQVRGWSTPGGIDPPADGAGGIVGGYRQSASVTLVTGIDGQCPEAVEPSEAHPGCFQ